MKVCLEIILYFENSKVFTAIAQKVLQGVKKSFEYAHWNIKVYWILPDTLWNSTTVTMLTYSLYVVFVFVCT